MSDPQTTKNKLKKLHGDLVRRANGFGQHQGLFSGALLDEELTSWALKLWEIVDEA